ncbi:hypothetical protein [Desulfofundulus sp.]|uniref:hypothetical protein n=1 Tax=Desulfofundulus sp. TaxID=2282750 RepID=UPI003C7101C9
MKKITVGIAGTAKNTGKTTTTITLLNHFYELGTPVGLTSIGYDGETVDNVTGLPKPRLFVRPGLMVATAEKCLLAGSAGVRVLDRLEIGTPLGRIACGRVEREGLLVVAGPNQVKHVRTTIDYFYRQGVELVILDGALNRMVPMVEADGLILATGAAFNQDISQVALQARYFSVICNRPRVVPLPEGIPDDRQTVVWSPGGDVLAFTSGSLFRAEQLEPLRETASQAAGFYCPGVIAPDCLKQLLKMPFPPGTTFIFADPVKLIISGNPASAVHFIEAVLARGGAVGYRRSLPLVAVTINPFYPSYRYETGDYRPAYVDGEKLFREVSALAGVPVFDVVARGGEGLASLLRELASPKIPLGGCSLN